MSNCRFSVREQVQDSETLLVMQDGMTGAEVVLWPGFGNQCLSLRLPDASGEMVHLIDDLQSMGDVRTMPSRYGNPILFPWPGSIPGGEYHMNGRRIQAQELGSNGAASHGLVNRRGWRVLRKAATNDGAEIACEISTGLHPTMMKSYPVEHRLEVTYRLDPTGVRLTAEVENQGDGPMPFGLGFHPYFTVPISTKGSRAECEITVRAARQWQFDAISQVGSAAAPLPQYSRPNDVPDTFPLGSQEFNHGFTDLDHSSAGWSARLRDPSAGVSVAVEASKDFQTMLLYSPADRARVCLEPWTCTANAFNLAASGAEDTGLITLEPGETWSGWMKISLEGT